jgi:hypothetical protein
MDDIVRGYAAAGVKLVRLEARLGKTAGLNLTVPGLQGEIVVFSDANAIYERDALLKLARNFADPQVGCVTGEARYVAGSGSAADAGERAYWDYEIQIKRLETSLGSMVGGDGAIYALRRTLWRELPANAINDFLNPLQVGLRAGSDLLRGNGRRHSRRVSPPRSDREPQLAGGVSGARRAEPVPGRRLHVVAHLPQGAALAVGAVRLGECRGGCSLDR